MISDKIHIWNTATLKKSIKNAGHKFIKKEVDSMTLPYSPNGQMNLFTFLVDLIRIKHPLSRDGPVKPSVKA